ncbi:hypothetical protein IM543_19945 [Massilia sp. UMI-21]|nr:hypothetical protein IM543_19945 [Massilia sp. UMI-21]
MKDGMVQDDVVYRCIGPHCGRLMPRRVNFCPWCGTAQQAGQPAPAGLAAGPACIAPVPAKPPVEPPRPVSATPAPTAAPSPAPTASPAAGPMPGARPQAQQPPQPPQPPQPQQQRGRGIPPPPGVGRAAPGPTPAQRAQRAPIRLRWWIVSLAALWLVWIIVRPEGTRIERRMERAVALAVECKARQAQDELIALRDTRATPEQLRQVQQSLNKAAADCTRAEQRARAWRDASAAIQKLRRAHTYDTALARLAVFTKRWGEDDQTRALALAIKDEREHPLADPTRGE